ncbi:MAG: GtrA family protein [Bacteroidales bacterium]|nr:GtrA family protein [Bacteroidales bacterium]
MIKFQINRFILSIINLLYVPFKKFIPPETFRYAVTGGFNLILDIFLYFIFYNFILQKQIVDFGIFAISPHIAAFVFVFPITFTTGFLFAKYITFTDSYLRGKVQLFRYALSVGGSILLNYVSIKLFVEYLFIWPTIAKIFTTVIVVIYSYLVQRYYTFKTADLLKKK